MRLHITLDDALVAELDRHVAPRQRSKFITDAIEDALARSRQYALLESVRGTISDTGHVWDPDPAAWVSEERFSDPRRVG